MAIWSAEIKELERLNVSLIGHFPELEKEMGQLVKTEDENVAMLYSRRCLELIVTDLCECELKRPRKTEPLKGIIDKLNKEEKVASYIVTSMHSLNSLSTYGAHPKDFDPEQVKPALSNLSIVLKWYLKYKGIEILSKPSIAEEDSIAGTGKQVPDATKLEKSVAILPFINDSKDEENTYFINGLMEEVLNNLQKIKDLRVISRTSVEQYRNQTKPIPEIARELGVNYIVEGSAQKYGNVFRLRTQLIMAAKESHLWGESYQQKINEVEDIFGIQSQIAESIAKELKAVITPQEKQLIEKIPTKELEAYDAYLKGQFYWRKLTKNDLETALQYFELAKEKDQEYALAYAGISDVWIALQQMGYAPPDEAGPKAMASIMKALELDSTLAQVHYSLALVRYASEWDWESGEAEFQKTFAINPNYAEAHAYYSHLLNMVGRSKEAMEQIELALKLDPHNPLLKSMYGMDLLFVHQFDEAISVSLEALKMDPTNPVAFTALAVAFHSTGRLEEALESWKSYCCNTYKGIAHAFDQGYKKAGYVGSLRFEADTLAAQSKTTFVMPSDIAVTYALSENRKLAVEWLETAYEVHDPGLPYLLLPIFDSLRADSRFQAIARKMNLPYK
jgi:TolB-like protein/lipoprotein NlpI